MNANGFFLLPTACFTACFTAVAVFGYRLPKITIFWWILLASAVNGVINDAVRSIEIGDFCRETIWRQYANASAWFATGESVQIALKIFR